MSKKSCPFLCSAYIVKYLSRLLGHTVCPRSLIHFYLVGILRLFGHMYIQYIFCIIYILYIYIVKHSGASSGIGAATALHFAKGSIQLYLNQGLGPILYLRFRGSVPRTKGDFKYSIGLIFQIVLKALFFCLHTFGVRLTIDPEKQPGSGKIRTGSGSRSLELTEDA